MILDSQKKNGHKKHIPSSLFVIALFPSLFFFSLCTSNPLFLLVSLP